MEALSWTGTTGDQLVAIPLDEELDNYRLLAYVQRVQQRYRENKLYPHLDDLRVRLDQLANWCERRTALAKAFPRSIKGFDLGRGALMRSEIQDDRIMDMIDSMIANALPGLGRALEQGAELREILASRIHFEPIGVLPLRTTEGYLLLRQGATARAYSYSLSVPARFIERAVHLDVRTRFIADYTIGLSCTFEHIKADLVRKHADLPEPSVFAFTSAVSLPAIETFVPLAKRVVYELASGGKA